MKEKAKLKDKLLLKSLILTFAIGIGGLTIGNIGKSEQSQINKYSEISSYKSLKESSLNTVFPPFASQGEDTINKAINITENSVEFVGVGLEDNVINNIVVENTSTLERRLETGFVGTNEFKIENLEANTTYNVYIWYYDSNLGSDFTTNLQTFKTLNLNGDNYDSSEVYQMGDVVVYQGITWEAKWYIDPGNEPTTLEPSGSSTGWKIIDGTVVDWSNKGTYVSGDSVNYNGNEYEAIYWNSNSDITPDNSSAWKLV